MRISDWSSDVCSSDLRKDPCGDHHHRHRPDARIWRHFRRISTPYPDRFRSFDRIRRIELLSLLLLLRRWGARLMAMSTDRSEEHTSELQSLMRISYAVFCLKNTNTNHNTKSPQHIIYFHTHTVNTNQPNI